ncbi:hypothetical protein GF420_08405 [candidate division GN15 bacterium]|nr:hypothetical protein [candidate division GN15 bacterium]
MVMTMKYDLDTALYHYDNIKQMLSEIPRDLWEVFLPANEDDLPDLEMNILSFRKREQERERVMSLQRLCQLPLRPNQSLKEAQVKARLQGLKKGRMLDNMRDSRRHRDDDSEPSA